MHRRTLQLSIVQDIVGYVWMTWGLSLWKALGGSPPAWTPAAALIVTVAIGIAAVVAFRRSHAVPVSPTPGAAYGLVTSGTVIAAAAAAFLCSRAGRTDLMLPAASIVVGAHFVALVPVFRARVPALARRFLVTGSVAIVFTVACLALASAARQIVVGGGMAALLWTTVLLHITGATGA